MPDFFWKRRSSVPRLLLISVTLLLLFSALPDTAPYGVALHAGFYELKKKGADVWVGGGLGATKRGATLGMAWEGDSGALSLRSARNMYLVCDGRRALFITRAAATAASELWRPHVLYDGTVALASLANHRFLYARGDRLWCDARQIAGATLWMRLMPKEAECRRAGNVDENDTRTEACWSIIDAEAEEHATLLFATMTPLKRAEPSNASDMYDPVIITRRTLINWAKLPRVQPVILSDDTFSQAVIEKINAEHAEQPDFTPIDIIDKFELHEVYRQPTFRGLFQAVTELYPFAKTVMYADMDILFSSSLANTIDAVQHVHEARRLQNPLCQGWFIVGGRTDVDVPAGWSMAGRQWESRLETELRSKGGLFAPDAAGYLIMTPGLFDWNHVPPFIVGGTVFGNWLTSQAVLLDLAGRALAVDATGTLTAIHQNHGVNVYANQTTPDPAFNLQLSRENGGMPHRLAGNCPHYTRYGRRGKFVVVSHRKAPNSSGVVPDDGATTANMTASNTSMETSL